MARRRGILLAAVASYLLYGPRQAAASPDRNAATTDVDTDTNAQNDLGASARSQEPENLSDRNAFSTSGTFESDRWKRGGPYVGAHVAYEFGSTSTGPLSLPQGRSETTSATPAGGLHLGYGFPLHSRVAVGVETDVSFPNFLSGDDVVSSLKSNEATLIEQLDCLGTLRSRIGYARDRWLWYVTGGYAWSRARWTQTTIGRTGTDENASVHSGLALGLGTEIGIAKKWIARLELLHDEFFWAETRLGSATAPPSTIHVTTLRLGIGWLP